MNKVRFSKFEQLKTEKKYKRNLRLKKDSFFTLLKEQRKIRKNKPIKISYYERRKIKSTKYNPLYGIKSVYENPVFIKVMKDVEKTGKEVDIENKKWAKEMKEISLKMIEDLKIIFNKNQGEKNEQRPTKTN